MRNEVLVVAEQQLMLAFGGDEVRVRRQVAQQVGVEADARVDADAQPAIGRAVSSVLERLPGALEHHAVLRIEKRRFARREPKERRVELVRVIDDAFRANVVRILEKRRVDARRRAKLSLVESTNRLHAPDQRVPERLDVVGARHAARHADDGDGVLG